MGLAMPVINLPCLKVLQNSTRILHLGVPLDSSLTCFMVLNHLIRIYVHGWIPTFRARLGPLKCLMVLGATINPIQVKTVLQQYANPVVKCENKQKPDQEHFLLNTCYLLVDERN